MGISDNVSLYAEKYSKKTVNYYKLTNNINSLVNTWKYITKAQRNKKSDQSIAIDPTIKTSKIVRLENLLWRNWYKKAFNLKSVKNFETGIDYNKTLIGPVTDLTEINHCIWNRKLKRCSTNYSSLVDLVKLSYKI